MMDSPLDSNNKFIELAAINVSKYVELKGKEGGKQFSYLSWAWAVDQLLRKDPMAVWDFKWFGDLPFMKMPDGTCMVFCAVTAFGVTRTAHLPVIDHANQPITNPDSFDLNTSMQRALAKAIALHGVGLYIYAGEDLPLTLAELSSDLLEKVRRARNEDELGIIGEDIATFIEDNPELRDIMAEGFRIRRAQLAEKPPGTKGVQGLKARIKAGKESHASKA